MVDRPSARGLGLDHLTRAFVIRSKGPAAATEWSLDMMSLEQILVKFQIAIFPNIVSYAADWAEKSVIFLPAWAGDWFTSQLVGKACNESGMLPNTNREAFIRLPSPTLRMQV